MLAHRGEPSHLAIGLEPPLQARLGEVHQPNKGHRQGGGSGKLLRPGELSERVLGDEFVPDDT